MPSQVKKHQKARAFFRILRSPFVRLRKLVRSRTLQWRLPFTGGRRWRSAIGFDLHKSIQLGTLEYKYRGVSCVKHPVEFALYMLLLWNQKPLTVIEIGTNAGGSALWMADQLKAFGIDGRVVSIDINPPEAIPNRPDIVFLRGDANQLAKSLSTDFLSSLPHPWVVIEDASHQYQATLAVLRFFDPLMRPGEYIVVEDGNVSDMGEDAHFKGGPGRAIAQFLLETKDRYEIDTDFCDFYGHNVTANPNGYLRRRNS
jgi:cephalosporin hydroxylase